MKILLGMASFMLFIIGMVAYMFHVHGRDALIEENYYENGINYDKAYHAQQQVAIEKASPKITVTENQIIIELKKQASYELLLLRPSNQRDDMKLRGETAEPAHLIVVNKKGLARGMWFLQLKWRAGNKEYLFKNNITL
ncbi:FixH family protein [Pedobacter frigidisoli]|uniref:FixH family protein n=1 Tax=Pedobacter frigidisoli TaxID=2530455 RepID=UPI002930E864|nr:FixH family protein [Pedobacter frigidisoli]